MPRMSRLRLDGTLWRRGWRGSHHPDRPRSEAEIAKRLAAVGDPHRSSWPWWTTVQSRRTIRVVFRHSIRSSSRAVGQIGGLRGLDGKAPVVARQPGLHELIGGLDGRDDLRNDCKAFHSLKLPLAVERHPPPSQR